MPPSVMRMLFPTLGDALPPPWPLTPQHTGTIIFAGDRSAIIDESAHVYIKDVLPAGWDFKLIQLPVNDQDLRNYKEEAQMLIAQLQSAAFTEARKIGATYCWSIETDVLVPPNALNVLMDCLHFDNGYYDVAMCSYPSQGGGSFLGGRGDYHHHIGEDILSSERKLPQKLTREIKKREKESQSENFQPSPEWVKRGHHLTDEAKQYPPLGNVFALNSERWRPRGWMEHAYPALGKGAILPTDWVGFGCTLMSKKALALAHFDGYEGKGTQDLYVGWTRWKPNDLNLCVTTHAICDHVVRKRKGDEQFWKEFVLCHAYHEPEGELKGHLRQRHIPFYSFAPGETFHPSRDARIDVTPEPTTPKATP